MQAEYYYPLNQSARFMWYHDHAFGITRLNAYAGIASGLLIRDNFEASLIEPGPAQLHRGRRQRDPARHPGQDLRRRRTSLSDRSDLDRADRRPAASGMPHTYEPDRWDAGGPERHPPLPDPSVVPEFFGDTMLVNGTAYPEGHGRGAPLPPAAPQRLQRPVPEPAALRGRRQPGRDHPERRPATRPIRPS